MSDYLDSNGPARPRRTSVLLGAAVAAAFTLLPVAAPEISGATAQAQSVSVNVQFRSALEPHGQWRKHNRWGEVWTPAKRDRDWRPYTVGRWAYTDEWGWYWASDEDFGYVTYHYGRWVLDSEFGWVWIPGDEWAPAWVQWRRGDRHAGWAPLPPREVIYDYDDNPDYWVFVSFNNFTAPNIRRVIVPRQERVVFIRQTVVVNRTIIVSGGSRIAVNPGIEPQIVAARVGRPIRVANVRPVVLAGTVGVQGAVEIRADSKDRKRERVRAEITERKETIAPAKDVPAPKALAKDEEGRMGDRPPAAAKEQAQQKPAERSTSDDATKAKQEDSAKAKQDDAAKANTDDADKAKSGDAARTKSDDAAKAKSGDAARSKSDEGAKARSDEAAKAKADTAKSGSDDAAKAKRAEPKGEAKSQARDVEKSKAMDRKQAEPKSAPKAAPEPKQAAPKQAPEPKQAAPKQAPEPRRAAPEPKQAEPKSAPEPRQAAPEPRQAAPKAEPAQKAPAPKGKGKDDEKG
jgi:hypothetical protein